MALDFFVSVKEEVTGQSEAVGALKEMESALKADAKAIRNLEAMEKRLNKTGKMTEAQQRDISGALGHLRARLATNTQEYARMATAQTGAARKGGALGNVVQQLSSRFGGLGSAIGAAGAGPIGVLVAALAGAVILAKKLAGALADAGKKIASSARYLEDLEFGLSKFLGGTKQANAEIQAVMKLANKYGLDFKETASSFKDLISAGFGAEAAKSMLLLKADLLALNEKGEEGAQKIGEAFGHISKAMAKGRIEADAFQEILGNLPITKAQIMAKLAPKMGKSLEEVSKMDITKLPIDQLIASIKEATLEATGNTELGAMAAEKATTTVGGAIDKLKKRAGNVFDEIASKMETSDGMADAINSITAAFDSPEGQEAIQAIADVISAVVNGLIAAIPYAKSFISGFVDGLKVMKPGLEAAKNAISAMFGGDTAAAGETLKAVLKGIGYAIGFVVSAMANIVAGAVAVGAAFAAIISKAVELGAKALALGKALITGLVSGIKAGAQAVVDAVSGVVTGAIDGAKALLGIKSPSKVFERIGAQTTEGMERGVEGGKTAVQRQVAEVVAPPPTATQNTNSTSSSVSVGGVTVQITGVERAEQIVPDLREALTELWSSLAHEGA